MYRIYKSDVGYAVFSKQRDFWQQCSKWYIYKGCANRFLNSKEVKSV